MEAEDKRNHVVNHFEAGSNCQVFNGNVSGCVFAMPGSTVTQHPASALSEGEQDLADRLAPIFYGDEAEVRKFLTSIRNAKPTQVTELVNRLVRENKISDRSHKHDLWSLLHEARLYGPSESNWNMQVR